MNFIFPKFYAWQLLFHFCGALPWCRKVHREGKLGVTVVMPAPPQREVLSRPEKLLQVSEGLQVSGGVTCRSHPQPMPPPMVIPTHSHMHASHIHSHSHTYTYTHTQIHTDTFIQYTYTQSHTHTYTHTSTH